MKPKYSDACVHLQERLYEFGALDAYYTPVIMKKGRPAHELTVLSTSDFKEQLLSILAEESTTIGIRVQEVSRRKASRTSTSRTIPGLGTIQFKSIHHPTETREEPEYEDVKRISRELGLPIREVYDRIRKAV